jgi:hypothetical protein
MSTDEKNAIREALAEYCFALDNFRFAELGQLFTADGVWETAFGKATGQTEIAALAASFTKDLAVPPRRIHMVANIVIKLNGDEAAVQSNWTQVQNSDTGPIINSGGSYEDRLVKRDGKWLFQHRKIDRFVKAG